jgi:protein SCO1/2
MRSIATAAFGLFLLAGLAGCAPEKQTYLVRGTVVAVDSESAHLRVAHEEIPGFMPAMTMNLDLASGLPIGDLRPGDAIRFTLEKTPRSLRITHIEKRKVAGEPGVAAVEEGSELAPLRARKAPPIRLTDQAGRPFDLAAFEGKAVLLDFVFTSCTGPCPILTAAHVRLQRRLPARVAGRVQFLSVSLDPVHDTPSRLRAYARSQGANLGSWSFLTGSPEAVGEVLSAYHVGRVRLPDETLNHTIVTYLIDRRGFIRKHYLGLDHDPDGLMADLLEVIS